MDFPSILQNIIRERQRILVIGLGISGIETAAFCRRMGIETVCLERMNEQEYQDRNKFASRLEELRAAGVEMHFGLDGEEVGPHLRDVGLGVLSPGVSHESAIYGALRCRGLPLVSELELGLELYRYMGAATSVVISGSNGKSTTVSLLHEILVSCGRQSVLCGNVGTPVVAGLSGDVLRPQQDSASKQVIVVEASSYQLEACSVLKPHISALLNLSDNHLERHGTMERYFSSKARMFACQSADDFALLNADDQWSRQASAKSKGRVFWFGCLRPESRNLEGVFFDYHPREGRDALVFRLGNGEATFDLPEARLLGSHNRYNMSAAALAAGLLGLRPAEVVQAIASFHPLEHRLEFIEYPSGGIIINDSKSTTVAASVAAVACVADSFAGRKITLLLGGLVKAGSWEPLMKLLKLERSRLREVICFGQDGKILLSHCRAAGLPCSITPRLREAVSAALSSISPGEIVLLSPGCASFDEFTDFEDRGRRFKEYVHEHA